MVPDSPSDSPERSLKVGVLVNNLEGRYQTQILRGIKDFSLLSGVQPVIFSGRSLGSPYAEEELYNRVYLRAREFPVDGYLVVAGAIGTNLPDAALAAHLEAFRGRPLVTLGRRVPGFPGLSSEDGPGVEDSIDHLVTVHGYRTIAFLSGPEHDPASRVRLDAYRRALARHGQAFRPELVYWGDYSFRCCPAVGAQMLRTGELPFDALVCANDEMAIGIQQALEASGHRVPQDYGLVGFDDLPAFSHRSPGLSTVRQPLYEQTLAAGNHLLERIRRADPRPLEDLPCPFVRRETCGCSPIPVQGARHGRPGSGRPGPSPRVEAQAFLDEFFTGATVSPAVRHEVEGFVPSLVDSIHLDLRALKEPSLFLLGLNEWLEITFGWDRYAETWNALFGRMRAAFGALAPEPRTSAYLAHLFSLAEALLARRSDQRESGRMARALDLQSQFQELSRRLNATRTAQEVVPALADAVAPFGLTRVLLVLAGPGETSVLHPVWGMGVPESGTEGVPADPGSFLPSNPREEVVFLPLVSQGRSFGEVLMAGSGIDPLVYSTLQEEIAQTLQVVGLFAERQAVEDQKLAVLEEHRRSEERYREMAQMVPMLMWETDTRLKVTYLNQAAEQGLGLKVGDGLRPRLSPSDREKVDLLLARSGQEPGPSPSGLKVRGTGDAGVFLIVQLTTIWNSPEGWGLRWHAFDPVPVALESVFPDQGFFDSHQLSDREREILLLVFQGLRNREIADRFSIAESTVKGHVSHIFDKFGVDSRQGLMEVLQEHQVSRHGYGPYLLMVLNRLLSGEAE